MISGTLRGRRLVVPPGLAIRPTADRIKESVFNILSVWVRGKRVLDLFAGSGALGIEALSRGAVCAVFVDQAKIALDAIRRNIRDLGLEDRSRVLRWDIRQNISFLKSYENKFNLIFMDPPYETHAVMPVLSALASCGALAAGSRLVIEHSIREPLDLPMAKVVLVDQRRFGKTLVSFMDTML